MMIVNPRRLRFLAGAGGTVGTVEADGCPAGAGLVAGFTMEGEFVSGFEGSMT